MSGNAYWNPAMDPDKSGGLEKLEWPRHVWDGHVRKWLLEPGQEIGYVRFF
jgi:hypothetical protein